VGGRHHRSHSCDLYIYVFRQITAAEVTSYKDRA
jgi:hypothetical protein